MSVFVSSAQPAQYSLRWFIWAIMFLLTTGVLLVTYITYTTAVDDVRYNSDFTLIRHTK